MSLRLVCTALRVTAFCDGIACRRCIIVSIDKQLIAYACHGVDFDHFGKCACAADLIRFLWSKHAAYAIAKAFAVETVPESTAKSDGRHIQICAAPLNTWVCIDERC